MKKLTQGDMKALAFLVEYLRRAEENSSLLLMQYTDDRELIKKIQANGGIRMKKGMDQYTEFIEALPKGLRLQLVQVSGLPLDEMSDILCLSSNELIHHLARAATGRKELSDFIPQARNYLYFNDTQYRDVADNLEALAKTLDTTPEELKDIYDSNRKLTGPLKTEGKDKPFSMVQYAGRQARRKIGKGKVLPW